jgi:hypothetical protein
MKPKPRLLKAFQLNEETKKEPKMRNREIIKAKKMG